MITVEDLRNPARASGFTHVKYDKGARLPYRAQFVTGGGSESTWAKPTVSRATAEEAAQDAADYLNGVIATAERAHRLRREYTPGVYDVTDPDTGRKIEVGDIEEPKRPISADGPTHVYVVAFVNRDSHPKRPNRVVVVKVGTTVTKNRSKYAITIGLDVREIITPITCPSRAEAEVAARKLEAALDNAAMFKRTGAECFAPACDATFEFILTAVRDAFAQQALAV